MERRSFLSFLAYVGQVVVKPQEERTSPTTRIKATTEHLFIQGVYMFIHQIYMRLIDKSFHFLAIPYMRRQTLMK
jgi:hypothetical protein